MNGPDEKQTEGETLTATGGKLSLPAGAARFGEMMAGISPAKEEKGSVAGGVLLCLLGVVAYLFIALAPLMIDSIDSDAIGVFMIAGLAVLILCLVLGIRTASSGSIAKVAGPMRETIAEHLFKDEEILAFCSSKRMGMDFWMHGMTPTGIIVFTNRRIFLIVFASAFKSPVKALRKREGLTVMACDGASKEGAKWGGLMMPVTLHLFGSRLSLKPEGKDRAVPYAVMHLGSNWKTIKVIKGKMTRS
jgi:hypothetical protein